MLGWVADSADLPVNLGELKPGMRFMLLISWSTLRRPSSVGYAQRKAKLGEITRIPKYSASIPIGTVV